MVGAAPLAVGVGYVEVGDPEAEHVGAFERTEIAAIVGAGGLDGGVGLRGAVGSALVARESLGCRSLVGHGEEAYSRAGCLL